MSINMHPVVHKLGVFAKQTPALRYDGKSDFFEWQKAAREKLSELLGMEKYEHAEECFTITSEEECEEYREYRFTIQSEENYHFPCVLRLPKNSQRCKADTVSAYLRKC